MAYLPGIDISNNNEGTGRHVDMPSVQRAGYQFVLMKATQGTGFVDGWVGRFYNAARSLGLGFGTYHYADGGDPVAEADHFLSIVMPLDEGQVLMLDWEVDGFAGDPVAWCWQFSSHVHDVSGIWPMVYMSGSRVPTFYGSSVLANDGLVVAWYGRDPNQDLPLNCTYIMHQFTSTGLIPGCLGYFDLDAFFGTLDQFNAYGYHAASPAPPAPTPVEPTPPVPTTPDVPTSPAPEPDPVPVPDPGTVVEPTPPVTPAKPVEPKPVVSPDPSTDPWYVRLLRAVLAVFGINI